MTKKLIFLVSVLLLGGCALPLPVQIASWAIDGLLFVTTEKTLADHGVSVVAQRDCALLRVVTEGSLCREDDAATAIAFADLEPPAEAVEVAALVSDEAAARLASFATAAGGEPDPLEPESTATASAPNEGAVAESWQSVVEAAMLIDVPASPATGVADATPEAMCDASEPVAVAEEPASRPTEEILAHDPAPAPDAVIEIATVELAALVEPVSEPASPEAMCDAPAPANAAVEVVALEPPPADRGADAAPWPAEALSVPAPDDLYYVVGTFMEWISALAFAARHVELEPTILSARLDGRRLYRIAVGPVEPLARTSIRQRLRGQGLIDAWAARMAPETWSIVATTGPPERSRAQIAQVWPPPLGER
jgi:hypothetical protein